MLEPNLDEIHRLRNSLDTMYDGFCEQNREAAKTTSRAVLTELWAAERWDIVLCSITVLREVSRA